jgi:hypothetical protein
MEAKTRLASIAVQAHVSEAYSRATQGEPHCKCLLIEPLSRFLPASKSLPEHRRRRHKCGAAGWYDSEAFSGMNDSA